MENEEFNISNRQSRKRSYGFVWALVGMAVACVLFVAGILIVNKMILPQKPGPGTQVPAGTGGEDDERIVSDELEGKLELVDRILKYYYLFDEGEEEIDFDSAIIKGYVNALGDPYTVYYTPEEFKTINEEDSGVYEGIGVSIQQNASNMNITIIRVFRDSPAEKAGLKAGDILYKIDGEDITEQDINLVVTKVRGKPNTTVNVEVYRPSINDYYTGVCTRAQVTEDTVTWEMKEDNVGYIEVTSFDGVTGTQFKEAYNDLHDRGMKGLIIDLRSNGGGYVDVCCDMLDFLLPEGVVTYTVDKYQVKEEYKSDKKAALDVPLILLVNGYSASASEIFCGAIRDFKAGELMGTQTFGKGIVQISIPLSDGSAVKVTLAYFYSPSGVCIHKEGFTPEYIVEYDPEAEEDNQLQEALKKIKEKMAK